MKCKWSKGENSSLRQLRMGRKWKGQSGFGTRAACSLYMSLELIYCSPKILEQNQEGEEEKVGEESGRNCKHGSARSHCLSPRNWSTWGELMACFLHVVNVHVKRCRRGEPGRKKSSKNMVQEKRREMDRLQSTSMHSATGGN